MASLRRMRSDTKAYASAAAAEHVDAEHLAQLPDAALAARIRLLGDRIHQGSMLTEMCSLDSDVQRLAAYVQGARELACEGTRRFADDLRAMLRELGSRHVAADLIDAVDDVYYLTCDELMVIPPDVRLRVKRRRAERERLQAQHSREVVAHA